MTARVAIARGNALSPGNFWKSGIGDLIIDVAAPIIDVDEIDAVFAAASGPLERQTNAAAFVADRLGLNPKHALSLDAGDVSGAAAFSAAYLHVASGAARTALVIAAAKSSDRSEAEKLSCLDRLLDQEADVARGIDFAMQAGLLARHYCNMRGLAVHVFAETTAANLAAWARHVERPAVTIEELRRDLVAAAPLVRSDFANMSDGACALILRQARKDDRVVVEGVASATDIVSLWDRRDPLAFAAVERAVSDLSARGFAMPHWWEIDAAVSVVQRLSQDALHRAAGSETPSELFVNLRGGSFGRGRVFGASPLYQLLDIVKGTAPRPAALAVAVGGLGSQAFAAYLSVGGRA